MALVFGAGSLVRADHPTSHTEHLVELAAGVALAALPIVFEPFFLREHWSAVTFDGAPLAAGLLLGVVGTMLTAGDRAVGQLVARAQSG